MEVEIPQYITDILTQECKSKVGLKSKNEVLYFKFASLEGEITFNNGNIYQGYLKNGTMNDEGELIFHDGASYKGVFKDN